MADAIAGVAGSLVSLWSFYPVEVWKTNVQAQPHGGGGSDESDHECTNSETQNSRIRQSRRQRRQQQVNWFQGIVPKTLHVTSSSFCYFFIYSWIVSTYRRSQNKQGGNGSSIIITPMKRLMLSAAAAMLNTLFTLPLDVISARHVTNSKQIKHQHREENGNERSPTPTVSNTSNAGSQPQPIAIEGQTTIQSSSSSPLMLSEETSKAMAAAAQAAGLSLLATTSNGSLYQDNDDLLLGEEKKEDTLTLLSDQERQYGQQHYYDDASSFPRSKTLSVYYDSVTQLDCRNTSPISFLSSYGTPLTSSPSSSLQSQQEMHQLQHMNSPSLIEQCMTSFQKLQSLWKGLVPALLLCSNPAIHYTVFDVLKTNLLIHGRNSQAKRKLSMSQAFVLGLMAKFVATIVTYPLIRAKVMLMVSKNPSSEAAIQEDASSTASKHAIREGNSLLACLIQSYQRDGIVNGLYKGCSWQLIHTVLKSALMMMVRERITDTTHRIIVGEE